jgi:hypothetical protein
VAVILANTRGGGGGMDLSKVKLKKTETKDSSTQRAMIQLCQTSEDYQNLMEETYLEKYYRFIESFSFKSVFVPLSRPQALAIVLAHRKWKEMGKAFSWKGDQTLEEIAESIDTAKKHAGWPNIFVRLSSRSPKDAALSSDKFNSIFAHELEFVKKDEEGEMYEGKAINQKLHALYRASTYALRSESVISEEKEFRFFLN